MKFMFYSWHLCLKFLNSLISQNYIIFMSLGYQNIIIFMNIPMNIYLWVYTYEYVLYGKKKPFREIKYLKLKKKSFFFFTKYLDISKTAQVLMYCVITFMCFNEFHFYMNVNYNTQLNISWPYDITHLPGILYKKKKIRTKTSFSNKELYFKK